MTDKSKCTGCTACASACPKKCITMQADEEGFLYPVVDEGSCIHCGLCDKVCPAEMPTENSMSEIHAYAVMAKDTELRMQSFSGAMEEVHRSFGEEARCADSVGEFQI